MPALASNSLRGCASIAVLAMLIAGCASWTDGNTLRTAEKSILPEIQQNSGDLVLEADFFPIEIDITDLDQNASLWQWVDETAIDPSVRRKLLANGLRVGRVAEPYKFRARLGEMSAAKDVVDQFLSEASIASDVSHQGKRIPMRLGRRYELPVRQPIDGSHVTMVRIDDETIGRTLDDPQYWLAITPTSGPATQQVRLRVRPEIQYGAMRQKWVSSDSALRIDTRRESWSLEALDFELVLAEGDSLAISATSPLIGIGKQMLSGDAADYLTEQVVVVLKLAQVPSIADQL